MKPMAPEESLIANLRVLDLPEDAIEWLLDLWRAIQMLDDIADGDEIKDAEILPWLLLIGLPSNRFFREHSGALMPVMANAYLKWRAANTVEMQGSIDEKSFVWRAGYYDVVLQCVLLAHGPKVAALSAHTVLSLYGEKFEEYRMEFANA